jgi:hypothetical protein
MDIWWYGQAVPTADRVLEKQKRFSPRVKKRFVEGGKPPFQPFWHKAETLLGGPFGAPTFQPEIHPPLAIRFLVPESSHVGTCPVSVVAMTVEGGCGLV